MSRRSFAGGPLKKYQYQPDPAARFSWKAGLGLCTVLILAGGCTLPTLPDERSSLSAEDYQALYSHVEEEWVGDNIAALLAERECEPVV